MKIGEFYPFQEVMETRNSSKLFNFLPYEASCQPKLDGIRLQLHKENEKITIFSKKGIDVTHRFVEIVNAAKIIPQDNFILDGEGVCFYNERISFNKVLSKLRSGIGDCIFFGFDALMFDGNELIEEPFFTRRGIIEELKLSHNIRITPQFITSEPAALKAYYIESIKRGFEGIVYRQLYSKYSSGLNPEIRKLKPLRTLDVEVVLGEEKKDGYYSYDVKVKEGLIARVPTKEILKPGQIIEVRHEGIIDGKNDLGKTLRFPTLFRLRNDVNEPNSVGDKLEIE
ncbi:hypothetical protein HYX08_02930 [Candidatus Woesearchaeota archaeon]|nr:hypothetical protein [Candidatus Woesearchaeota archaeon]